MTNTPGPMTLALSPIDQEGKTKGRATPDDAWWGTWRLPKATHQAKAESAAKKRRRSGPPASYDPPICRPGAREWKIWALTAAPMSAGSQRAGPFLGSMVGPSDQGS
jgi:hypothetical protein